MELATRLKVQTFVLLHYRQRNLNQIRPVWDKALQLHKHWLARLHVLVNLLYDHHYLLVIVPHYKWTNTAVVRLHPRERCSVREYEVNIRKLVPFIDDSCHELLAHQTFDCVLRPSLAYRVDHNLYIWVYYVSCVLLSHFLGKEIQTRTKFGLNVEPVRVLELLSAHDGPKRKVLLSNFFGE